MNNSNEIRNIGRASASGTLSVSTFLSSGTRLDYRAAAGGMLYIPSGNSSTLSFYASEHPNGTYYNTYDSTGTVVSRTISNANEHQCIPFPDECFGAGYVEVVSDVAIDSLYYTLKG